MWMRMQNAKAYSKKPLRIMPNLAMLLDYEKVVSCEEW